jgi:hypothetical protein
MGQIDVSNDPVILRAVGLENIKRVNTVAKINISYYAASKTLYPSLCQPSDHIQHCMLPIQ